MGKGQWAIAVQGGAGDIPIDLPKHIKEGRESALRHCLHIGSSALNHSHSSLHVVELVVTFSSFFFQFVRPPVW